MKEWLKKINLNTLLFIGIIILAILYFRQCGQTDKLRGRANIAEMNQLALIDTVNVYETKNGDLVYEKGILIASKKELKDLNKELYDEVKDLENNPKIIFKETVKIVHDTVDVQTNVIRYPDGSIGLSWNYDTTYSVNNYKKLAGETKFRYDNDSLNVLGTKITKDETGMSFKTGLTEGEDTYTIFLEPDFPGFTVENLEGAVIDKKMVTSDESRVVVGPSVGYGVVMNPGGNISHGVTFGFSLTYNLNKKVKKLFSPYKL